MCGSPVMGDKIEVRYSRRGDSTRRNEKSDDRDGYEFRGRLPHGVLWRGPTEWEGD